MATLGGPNALNKLGNTATEEQPVVAPTYPRGTALNERENVPLTQSDIDDEEDTPYYLNSDV